MVHRMLEREAVKYLPRLVLGIDPVAKVDDGDFNSSYLHLNDGEPALAL